ncbi:MAG: hypothetical protein RIC89_01065 [Pseudomonadales bacterium]
MRFVVLLCLLLAAGPARSDEAAIADARQVMDDFMTAFNDRDVGAWADTLLFPHVRVASGGVNVTADKSAFVANTDMTEFAARFDWEYSEWDSVEVIQAGPEKVHFKVRFSRFNPRGEKNATFDSLYILQKVDGRWGIRARSSFAP